MKVIADLHLHSKYSRAVSQRMDLLGLAEWGEKKGINLIGAGDITHPLWLKELEANLEPAETGFYKLKDKIRKSPIRFVLAGEVSSIYSQGGKGRRIHNLILAPSLEVLKKINSQLLVRGCNLMSDGRPILGLSSLDVCELVFGVSQQCLIIPCHIWTPWFSLYGSKSGFDSVEECFGQWASKIYAIETGLSSDPAMNWRIKDLDQRTIVSFSDAHSPEKLGREATVFSNNGDDDYKAKKDSFDYPALAAALKQDPEAKFKIIYTVEFYPEEGKYHYSGHRKCGVRQSPQETKKQGEICPSCGRPLTLGVMHRVEQLAGRELELKKAVNKQGLMGIFNPANPQRPPYVMLVPLIEILAEAVGMGVQSQRVQNLYQQLIEQLGSEFKILLQLDLAQIEAVAGERVAEGLDKVRKGEIVVDPGYDGVFGVVSIWPKDGAKLASNNKQMGLF